MSDSTPQTEKTTSEARPPTTSEMVDVKALMKILKSVHYEITTAGVPATIGTIIEPAVLVTIAKNESDEELNWLFDKTPDGSVLSMEEKKNILASIFVRAFVVGARFRDSQRELASE